MGCGHWPNLEEVIPSVLRCFYVYKLKQRFLHGAMVRVITNHHRKYFIFRFVKTRTGASGGSITLYPSLLSGQTSNSQTVR
jgi:hypothetical protein